MSKLSADIKTDETYFYDLNPIDIEDDLGFGRLSINTNEVLDNTGIKKSKSLVIKTGKLPKLKLQKRKKSSLAKLNKKLKLKKSKKSSLKNKKKKSKKSSAKIKSKIKKNKKKVKKDN
jgi:hypothetical protein